MKGLFALVGFCLVLSACTQRLICPAYQSAFIYDKEALRKKFSYFQEDSTPKVFLTASKTKYLIAEPVSYRKKIRTMQTVEMKSVQVIVPDSFNINDDVSLAELNRAARSVIDSTMVVDEIQPPDSVQAEEDSVYVITKDKELRLLKYDPDSLKYFVVDVRLNVDQDNYMWYLRDYLILPDVRLSKMQGAEKNVSSKAKAKKEKKGFLGFFKGLFKKKNKEDSTAVQAPVKAPDDFDYVDTVEQAQTVVPQEKPAKKGLFSFLKKKNKTENASAPAEATTPAEEKPSRKKEKKPKKEEPKPEEKKQDDGF